jgi:hypothetical protein
MDAEFTTTYLTAVFLVGRGNIPYRAVPPSGRGEMRFVFPESARPELKELRAARGLLDSMAALADRPASRETRGEVSR